MRKLSLAVLILSLHFLFSLCAIAQSRTASRIGSTEPQSIISQPPLTKFGNSSWASGGAGVAERGVSSSAFTNPAAMQFDRTTVYLELGARPSTKLLGDFDYDGQFILPQFLSVGASVNGWNLSLGYANFYNQHLVLPGIPITTLQFPEGTGQLVDFERTVKSHVFFGSVGHSIDKDVSLGVTLGLNDVTFNERLSQLEATGSATGVLVVVGALVKPSTSLSVGGTVTYSSTVEVVTTYGLPESYTSRAKFPWMSEIGVAWEAAPTLKLLTSVEFQKWSIVSDAFDDQWNFHMGAAVSVSPTVDLRVGFFTQPEPTREYGNYSDQNYLTAGFVWLVSDRLSLSGAIVDSHVFSNTPYASFITNKKEQFHQTHISAGAEFHI